VGAHFWKKMNPQNFYPEGKVKEKEKWFLL
jgi:hypothetical protein